MKNLLHLAPRARHGQETLVMDYISGALDSARLVTLLSVEN